MNVPSPRNHATSSARTLRGVTSAPVPGDTSCKKTERRAKVSEEAQACVALVFLSDSNLAGHMHTFIKAHLQRAHVIIHRKCYARIHGRRQRELNPKLWQFLS